ncbi:MAG: hypothetical protein K2H74_04310 [Paramuribaculum sp.]|nr:hypothetical protein [Paramuribaculum sp.]
MKLNKIFAIALAALALTACSDDDNSGMNTASGVTVNFETATLSLEETDGLVKIPVKVTGKTNGKISMNVTVTEVGQTPAKEDIHYLLTDKRLIIGEGQDVGYIELKVVNDRVLNEDRKFDLAITNVSGAAKGQTATCQVTIKDNDALLYGRLQGSWTMNALDPFEDEEVPVVCMATVSGVNPGEEGYGEELTISFRAVGESNTYSFKAYLTEYSDGTPVLAVPLGQIMLADYNYGNGTYILDILLYALDLTQGGAYAQGTLAIDINEDESQLIWPEQYALMGYAMAQNGNGGYLGGLGWWTGYYDVTWNRE